MKKFIAPFIGAILVAQFATIPAKADETLGDVIASKSNMHVDSGGVITGIYFMYSAYQNFTQKGGDAFGGMTSAAVGASSALGAITLVTRANAAEGKPVRKDPVKEFMKTDDYELLAKQVGEKKAREFVLDMQSGWSVEQLYKKYGDIYHVTITSTAGSRKSGAFPAASNSDGADQNQDDDSEHKTAPAY